MEFIVSRAFRVNKQVQPSVAKLQQMAVALKQGPSRVLAHYGAA